MPAESDLADDHLTRCSTVKTSASSEAAWCDGAGHGGHRHARRSWPDSSSRCGRRARRSTRSSASATPCSSTPLPLPVDPDGARHRRHRRRPVRHGERLDHGVGRGRGIRCARRQARQPGGELVVGIVRRARRPRHRPDAARRARSPRSSARPASRSRSPRRSTPASGTPGPTRAELGVPTVFNFLGPLCNPARPEAIGGRRRAARPGAADRRRVPDPRRDRARVPRRRRARRAHDHRAQPRVGGLAAATCTSTTSTRATSASSARDIDDLRRRRRRAQRRDRARGARGRARARCATSCCSTPRPASSPSSSRRIPASSSAHPRPVPRQDGGRGGVDRQRRRRAQARAVDRGDQGLTGCRVRVEGPRDRRGPRMVGVAVTRATRRRRPSRRSS